MSRQLAFSLPVRTALGREDFFVSPANALALAALDRGDWPGGKMLMIGPEGAGKSHLAQVWANDSGAEIVAACDLPDRLPAGLALVIEDLDRASGDAAAERRIFHAHNDLLARGGRLLMTARDVPGRWPLVLPDLASRMAASPLARLFPPDDALLAAVMVKQFADRQIAVAPAVIAWLVTHMDRSFAAAHQIVAALDAGALAKGGPVTRALAVEVLDSLRPEPQ